MSYLYFNKTNSTGKTSIFLIQNMNGDKLGTIKWHGAWRKYCFFTNDNTIFDVKCMNEITDFIIKLMEERKNGRSTN